MTTIKLDTKRLLGYTEKEIAGDTNGAAKLAGARVGADAKDTAGPVKRSGAKVGSDIKRPRQ
jgi:hypothetical protein